MVGYSHAWEIPSRRPLSLTADYPFLQPQGRALEAVISRCEFFFAFFLGLDEGEEPFPSLSDFHDYEPNLEFDDTEVVQQAAAAASQDGLCLPLSPSSHTLCP